MMWPFNDKRLDEPSPEELAKRAERAAIQAACKHDDWSIYDSDNRGCGHCLTCGAQVGLPYLLRTWKERIEREIKQALEGRA